MRLLDVALLAGQFKQGVADDQVVGAFLERGPPQPLGLFRFSHAALDRGDHREQPDLCIGWQTEGLLLELREYRGGLFRRCSRRQLGPNRQQHGVIGNVGGCLAEHFPSLHRPLVPQGKEHECRQRLWIRRVGGDVLPQDLEGGRRLTLADKQIGAEQCQLRIGDDW